MEQNSFPTEKWAIQPQSLTRSQRSPGNKIEEGKERGKGKEGLTSSFSEILLNSTHSRAVGVARRGGGKRGTKGGRR